MQMGSHFPFPVTIDKEIKKKVKESKEIFSKVSKLYEIQILINYIVSWPVQTIECTSKACQGGEKTGEFIMF